MEKDSLIILFIRYGTIKYLFKTTDIKAHQMFLIIWS